MTSRHMPVLEFPEMLYGLTGAVRRKVRVQAQTWAREYNRTGALTPPRRMLQVPPGELLELFSGIVLEFNPRPRWRVHMFSGTFMHLDEGVPRGEYSRARELLDSFCMNTPWGALFHAVSPPPLRSAKRVAQRFAALLRFWDVLQGPRYAYRVPDVHQTLDELMDDIYRKTLEAWCPGGPASVREHMALVMEHMARATREDCLEAVLRIIPGLIAMDPDFQHRGTLEDPVFLRERLTALPTEDFDDISSAYKYTVNMQLAQWDRELEPP